MATIQPSDIPDVVATTRVSEGRLRFQQIAQNLPFYEIFSRWFKRDKVMFSSGYKIQRTLMNKLNRAAAKHVGFLQPDAVNIMDVLTTMSVEWVHAQTDWGIVYQTDVLMNSGKDLILNIIKPRRIASLLGLVEEIEELGFGAAPGVTDNVNPWGLKYWVVWNGTDGFTGGAPSGHTTKGGVNPTNVPNFKNYALTYTDVSDNDLVKGLRTMFRKCRFVSPISHPDYRGQIRDRYRLYCNEQTMTAFEDVVRSHNSNLGKDLAMFDGAAYIAGYPIIYIPQLDNDSTSDPVYAVDHSTFY
ncbi:hypothetical protein LCGC14_3159460, partial [marine sediment metagenome]